MARRSARGGMVTGQIDTCIKSDMARPTSVDQVIHASLKMCSVFSITKVKAAMDQNDFKCCPIG